MRMAWRRDAPPDQPICIYQIDLASWRRVPEEQNRPLTYSEIAPKLADYAHTMSFTHVQLHSPVDIQRDKLELIASCLRQRDLGVILETAQPAKCATASGIASPVDGLSAAGETRMCNYSYKWDTAWAEETCAYFSLDPIQRKFRQRQFTSRDKYAFSANYILPLSSKLVTRLRKSLLTRMPGDTWKKFANLRLLFAYTYLLPGKKLMFMGDEFGQENPWRPETSLDWHLLDDMSYHEELTNWVSALNRFYRGEQALYQTDSRASGFRWIDTSDAESSIISFLRQDFEGDEVLLAVFNFTPVPRHNYRVGVPKGGFWPEVLNSDALEHGGSGQGNLGGVEAAPFGWNYQSHSLMLTLPPLAAVVFKAPG